MIFGLFFFFFKFSICKTHLESIKKHADPKSLSAVTSSGSGMKHQKLHFFNKHSR